MDLIDFSNRFLRHRQIYCTYIIILLWSGDWPYFGLGGVYFVTGHIVTKCHSFIFLCNKRLYPEIIIFVYILIRREA